MWPQPVSPPLNSESRLESLDLQTILKTGFCVHTEISSHGKTLLSRVNFLINFGNGLRSDHRIMCFELPPDRTFLRWTPYLNEADELRFWDVDHGEGLFFRFRYQTLARRDSCTKDEVQARFPALFKFAQSLGHWT